MSKASKHFTKQHNKISVGKKSWLKMHKDIEQKTAASRRIEVLTRGLEQFHEMPAVFTQDGLVHFAENFYDLNQMIETPDEKQV